jgi:DNA helicase II / ATP-dependent DNA helicase PcrA
MRTTRLSQQQSRIVDHADGPLLVIAGPGSGKTRVLTERVRSLLERPGEHFKVLALTFTNKAADEMRQRLDDLGNLRQRASICTLHSFCLNMLTERGKLVGVDNPHIFEQFKDRKQVMIAAVNADPLITAELERLPDNKARNKQIDDWLQAISWEKAHPISGSKDQNELERQIREAYDAGLRACGAYDFDDLLLLSYQLLLGYPKIADFYRRIYHYVCIDEAQDLNEAQYAVLKALCGADFKNVLMVGDPNQSIYGFNTSSPEYMFEFEREFGAKRIELTENFRSSEAVVRVARSLEPKYLVAAQLPIKGSASLLVGDNEEDEAKRVADVLERLLESGHPDVEGEIVPSRCAVLGRTRYALLLIEEEFRARSIPYYKRYSANHENESEVVEDFQIALRVLANPLDSLHLNAIAERWQCKDMTNSVLAGVPDVLLIFERFAVESGKTRARAVSEALSRAGQENMRLDLMASLHILRTYADSCGEEDRLKIYEDLTVFEKEWDQYLRSESGHSVASFMSSRALGSAQQAITEGVGLLTVHGAKGLEFDVVFVAGMAQGIFPDYRAIGRAKEMNEEVRNAFVAVTRSKRLLVFSYPRTRRMPWGDERQQEPSDFLRQAGL